MPRRRLDQALAETDTVLAWLAKEGAGRGLDTARLAVFVFSAGGLFVPELLSDGRPLRADRIAMFYPSTGVVPGSPTAAVTDATLAAMEGLGASRTNIAVAIGPCIGRASYEVDDGFVQRFLADDPENEHFFAGGKPGHAMFDIAAYVAARLAAAGVSRIAIGGQDTYAEEADYFSYRRACHRGENSYGRQISLIGLR